MTRRLVYIAFGAAVGILVVHRATRAAKQFTPAGVQGSVTGALGGLTSGADDATGGLIGEVTGTVDGLTGGALDDATGGLLP